MVSRGLHALFASLPAIVAALAVVLVSSHLLDRLHATPADAATSLTAMLLWPLLPASAVLAGRAAAAWSAMGAGDPIRSLGITSVGGVWRIPVRARHPRTTGLLAALIAGSAMAALARGGLLGAPAWWHAGAAVGGSLVLGFAAFAVASVLDRQASGAMVLDPGEGVLLLPSTRRRRQVVRIRLSRIRWIRMERDGLLSRRYRVACMFDDEVLGQGVRDHLLDGVDPGRGLDLVAWIKPFVMVEGQRRVRIPVAAPAIPAVPAEPASHAAAAMLEPAPMASHAATESLAVAAMHPVQAGHPARPGRRGGGASRLASINLTLTLSVLGLAAFAGLMAMGVRIQPRQSAASPAEFVIAEGMLGMDASGRWIGIDDLTASWCWEVAVDPADPAVPLQMKQVARLAEHLAPAIAVRVVLVGDAAGRGTPDPASAARFAERLQLPHWAVLVRPGDAAATIGHRLLDDRGRTVHRDAGFMSAAAIQRQIELMLAVARMGGRP